MESQDEHLGLGHIAAYSLPAIPLTFMAFMVNLYLLKFTTDVLLIAPATFGGVFAASRVWDAISDPLVGHWSDRTRSRLGRRRPWILGASIPIGIAFAMLWSPPRLDGFALELWMAIAIFVYYTAYSAAAVPHLALSAELTLDYHERSRLATGRGIFELIGVALTAAALGFLASAQVPRLAATHVATLFAVATLVMIGIHVTFTTERKDYQGRGAVSLGSACRDVLRNPHARILLFVFFIEVLSLGFLGVLFPFLAEQLGSGVNPGTALGAVMVIAMLSVPVWLHLSRAYGKRIPWMIALGGKGVGFAMLYFIDAEISLYYFVVLGLIGAGQACTSILPTSIKADVIDYDELETGERKEGAYFAAWNLVIKLASAIAVGTGAFLLQVTDYQPEALEQSAATVEGIKALAAALPFGLHVIALIALFRFRLGPTEHARIRGQLDRVKTTSPRRL